MKITSTNNELIKKITKLSQKKYRDEMKQILLEGEHLLQEVINAQLNHTTIGVNENYDIQISDAVAKKISQTKSGSSVFTLIDRPEYSLNYDGDRYLLVDGVQDPGNLGTMIRTAYSFGFDAVVLSPNCVDEYNDKCIRATQGAILHIPCIRMNLVECLTTMKLHNIKSYATHLSHKSVPLDKVESRRVAIIMGHEGQGVSEEVVQASDSCVKIETSNFESLNVAIATAIICYTLRK